MNIIIYLVITWTALVSTALATSDDKWEEWKLYYGKQYSGTDEELNRKQIWISNYKLIQSHNMANHSFKLELNHFADLVRFTVYTQWTYCYTMHCRLTKNTLKDI